MQEVEKKAKIQSYVSTGGDTCRIEIGSEDYVIVHFNDKQYIDISLRNLLITVYDQNKKWTIRQIGTDSGKLIK